MLIQVEREKVCGSMGKKKGVWIQVEKRCVDPRKKEKRLVDQMGKRKGVLIQWEREKVCGSNGEEKGCVDPS